MMAEISKIALFRYTYSFVDASFNMILYVFFSRTLFNSEFSTYSNLSPTELINVFERYMNSNVLKLFRHIRLVLCIYFTYDFYLDIF